MKAYLKRSKTDANDAAAICEAVTRPSMRFVPIKTKEQQTALMLHRTRQLLVGQRTMLSNALRGHLAELGIVSAKGRNGTAELLRIITDDEDSRVSPAVRGILEVLVRQYEAIGAEIFLEDAWAPIGAPHGDIACFSFHPRKVVSTGDGGMLTTRHVEWDRRYRALRQHAMSVPDTVHLHGIHGLPVAMDGVAGISQPMVAPGVATLAGGSAR